MQDKEKLTIIICTRNRSQILERCISHLIRNNYFEHVEVLIVDNNSNDNSTYELVKRLRRSYENIRYIHEPITGLSRARNKGARCTMSEWLIYIDDDVFVPSDYLEKISAHLKEDSILACFGGPYYAHFDNAKPKWLTEGFGNKKWPITDAGFLKEGYISGGNFVIKKSALLAIGGFPENLGMQGDKLRYGEEDFVQDRLREMGYGVFFDPVLYVNHLVLPDKLELVWHLRHALASGYSQEYQRPSTNLYFLIRSFMGSLIFRMPLGIKKLMCNRTYYHQNLILDVLCPILFHWGKLKASLKHENQLFTNS